MSQRVEFTEFWFIFGAIDKGKPIKTALGKLGIMPKPQDLVLQRKHGLELLPWGLAAGSHGEEKERAFFEINFEHDSSSLLPNIARITFKRMSFEDRQVSSVVVEAENIDGNLSWRKINFRGNGRVSALTIELADSGEIEKMERAISKVRGGRSATFLATRSWERPAAKKFDYVYYGSNGITDGFEFVRSSLDFSYQDIPTQSNFHPLALINRCLDPTCRIDDEKLLLVTKVIS